MSALSLRIRRRTQARVILWVPGGVAVIWIATFWIDFVFDASLPLMHLVADLAQVGVALAYTWAATELLRIWGTATLARAGVAAVGLAATLAAVAHALVPGRVPLVVGFAATLGLIAIFVWPERAAGWLPRSPVWEVLHRLSGVTANADPLSQAEAIERSPEFVRMVDDAQRFRTAETAEYLDLFAAIADADLARAPQREDRPELDARWQSLHEQLAAKFAPFSTWRVGPDHGPRTLKAASRTGSIRGRP